MAYDLIEKHKYPAYDEYHGVAQRGTFTMSFGHLVSTSSVVNAITQQFEEKAAEDGAVPLGLEIWEETSLLEKRYKCTSYLYDPLGRGQTISGPITLIIISVIAAVIAICAVILAYFVSSAVISIAEMDWEGFAEPIRWGVYGIVAVGVIILGSILLKQRQKVKA